MNPKKWSKTSGQLTKQLRLRTSPVSVRFLESTREIPRNAKRPMRDLKIRMAHCQAVGLARLHGWVTALTWDEDMWCLRPALLHGFAKELDFVRSGELNYKVHNATLEAARKTEAAFRKIPFGRFHAIVFSPLGKTAFEPHVIVVYGSPAQIQKIVGATLWNEGGGVENVFLPGDLCHKISCAYLTGQTQVVLPCAGDRTFGGTDDDEMAAVIPAKKLHDIVEALMTTKMAAYPIRKYLLYEPVVGPGHKISYYDYSRARHSRKSS